MTVLLLALGRSSSSAQDVVPKTVEGGAGEVKKGGEEIGEGFTGIGRGIKKVFTGERSKEEFEKAGKIGEGFKDVGVGTAGVGRGVGRGVRDGFEGEGSSAAQDTPKAANGKIEEESLPDEKKPDAAVPPHIAAPPAVD